MSKRIMMIGPVYPYNTGISHYVSILYKQLSKKNEVSLISYTMMYPRFLYKKPQKDYEDDVLKLDDVRYMLHSANPFNWIKVASYINREKPDLLLLQWMHPYFAPCYIVLTKLISKSIKIMYICHNVFPHERFPLDKWLTKHTLRQADYFITHSKSDGEDLKTVIRDPKLIVAVHPAYNFFKIKNMSKEEARKILNIKDNEKVLLFFGLIREYKGLKHLLKAVKLLKEREDFDTQDLKLLIAGDFGSSREVYDKMIEEYNIGDMLDITSGYIPISEVEKFFAACDIVVLPYESATQSGVIQVAYSFRKPVLATRVGGLPDVVLDNETGYVVEPFDPGEIADSIVDFFDNDRAMSFMEGIGREAYRYSWDRMEENIYSLAGWDKED
ncbi:MAG: glycosyltransferase family 4 protein [Lachnospiraceae bacterium]|nr:glycosyltransferase family 4 protein [Lachnospiraceae bacterium]